MSWPFQPLLPAAEELGPVSASLAVTESLDVLAANAAGVSEASFSVTEGVDVLAANAVLVAEGSPAALFAAI